MAFLLTIKFIYLKSFLLKTFILKTDYLYYINTSKKIQTTLPLYSLKEILKFFWKNTLRKVQFLTQYYVRNENIWGDGFLFDFLQKKTADLWVRQFVIFTGFLFSERLIFDLIVRIYLDTLIWPLHYFSIFETTNVSEMLLNVLFQYVSLFIFRCSFYAIYF